MAKWLLLVLSLLVAGVVGCGDFDDGSLGSTSMAVAPQRDGGTNGFHCGPVNNFYAKWYVCVTSCKKGVCAQETVCASVHRAQKLLDDGALLGMCP